MGWFSRNKGPYQRLAGRGNSMLHVTELFMASDHLLQVQRVGWMEEYKRFYFRDIQAIAIRKTRLGFLVNIILGALALLWGAGIFLMPGDVEDRMFAVVFFAILFAVVVIFLVINLFLGPTCTCHVRTAVQTERLYSLNRIRTTRKAVDKLRAEIQAVQDRLAPEELQRRLSLLQSGLPMEETSEIQAG